MYGGITVCFQQTARATRGHSAQDVAVVLRTASSLRKSKTHLCRVAFPDHVVRGEPPAKALAVLRSHELPLRVAFALPGRPQMIVLLVRDEARRKLLLDSMDRGKVNAEVTTATTVGPITLRPGFRVLQVTHSDKILAQCFSVQWHGA